MFELIATVVYLVLVSLRIVLFVSGIISPKNILAT